MAGEIIGVALGTAAMTASTSSTLAVAASVAGRVFFELTCYPDTGRATSNALSVIKSIFIHYLPWDLQWR